MSEFFIALLNRSLLVSCMILALSVFRLVFRKIPKRLLVHSWLWVWWCLLWPRIFSNPWNILPTATVVEPEILYSQMPAIDTGIPAVNQAINPVIGETFAPAVGASVNPLQVMISVLSVIWLIGMVGMMIHGVISYVVLKRRVADAVLLKENIYESEKVKIPFVLGAVTPRIYLPLDLAERDRELVILHEKKHEEVGHPFMKILGYFLLCVYWFCPVVWFAYQLCGKDMELECDELVLKEVGEEYKKEYARALLNCSTIHQHIGACPVAFGEVGAKFRIKNILSYKKHPKWMSVVSFALFLGFYLLFLGEPMERRTIPEHIAYITDGTAEWNHVTELTLYADGYFGRTLEEPLVIRDEKIINELVTMITERKDYEEVEPGKERESLCGVFVDFGNGVKVSMYRYGNYGIVSDTMQTSGGTPYYLPEKFCTQIRWLLESNYPKATIDTLGVLAPSEQIDHFVFWHGVTGEGYSCTRNVVAQFDEILHRYENLEFVPFESEEDSVPQFSEYDYRIEVYGREEKLLQTVIPKENQICIDGVMYDCSVSDSLQELDRYIRREVFTGYQWEE